MKRSFYSETISNFIKSPIDLILGSITKSNEFNLELTQKSSWIYQIQHLKEIIDQYEGLIFFEFSIPRMGKRIDVLLVIKNVIFVLEYKVGEKEYLSGNYDQVYDYCLDLKNFHETSHKHLIVPILIATEANDFCTAIDFNSKDNLLEPIKSNSFQLGAILKNVLEFADGEHIHLETWEEGRYAPTPTIIEAAMALYNGHAVEEISRNDADAINLSQTSEALSEIILDAKINNKKVICFVTGVPGAGKTLVGLNIATKYLDNKNDLTSVLLSGNGPLVAILREALTRDKVKREKEKGNKIKKGEVMSKVKVFIQNVHNFRDDVLKDLNPPFEHIAIFDEAQRAWNMTQTSNFMKRKKGIPDFNISEPEFLISVLDRHPDWAVMVCLVGGGQEINTGEAGIQEWLNALNIKFPYWHVNISDKLSDSEYAAGKALEIIQTHQNVFTNKALHLAVSLRSFRAEYFSLLIKNLLDVNIKEAQENLILIKDKYPLAITRNLNTAKKWLRTKARGSERYGIIVSSQAQRLKPHAIDVRAPIDPIHWFLDGKEDVRSSYYLEDVATEFQVQGLELDWACVTWDGDFRYAGNEWQSYSFVGDKWHHIHKEERKQYLKNAYRVLLTRARQGMIIVVPEGDNDDPTRKSSYYDSTYEYLKEIGMEEV